MQAGAILLGEIAQTGGSGGIQADTEAVGAPGVVCRACQGAGKVQGPFVERLRGIRRAARRSLGKGAQDLPPIERVLHAGGSGQIVLLLASRTIEVAGDGGQCSPSQESGQFLRQDPERNAVPHGMVQCEPEDRLVRICHVDQPGAPQDHPGLSLLDLEKRMAFPREHLTFALWYLRSKGYVSQEDNSDCGITAEGIDFIESHCSDDDLIKKLIHAGPGMATAFAGEPGVKESPLSEKKAAVDTPPARLALTN